MANIGAATIYATTVSFSILVLGLYVLGAARYLTNLEENACEMTYMFEYPQYVRIALNEEIEERYPRFGLHVYGEGFVTEKHRRMKFSGIPVLFVPGNAGSHEQVRSLASVSLRKSIKDRTSFHFDYFTVSLGKDYSALYGGVLDDQTTYVSLCVSKILSLYKGNVDKIVLIGHSMGGIVAKAVLLRELISSSANSTPENKSVTSILLTLASPHKPIFLPDRTIARYYQSLESTKFHLSNESGTTFVSIAGGRRDILVSTSQTIEPMADLNVVSSGIPKVWTSTDHLCILWCKQLVMAIVRALFDCVDINNPAPKITSDPGTKIRALSYHFTSRILGKKLRPYDDKIKFERGGEWIEDIRRQYTWCSHENVNKTSYLMIRVGDAALSYDSISIEAINLEARDWLFACFAHSIEANSRVCEWGWNLTNRTNLSPDPIRRPRKSADIRLDDLRGWKVSHVVVRIPIEELRSSKKGNIIKIHVDLYNRGDRTFRLDDNLSTGATGPLNVLPLGRILTPNPHGIVNIPRGRLRYYAVLQGIDDAVAVEVEPRNDENDISFHSSQLENNDESPQAMLELVEPSSFNHGYTIGSQVRTIVADNKKDGQFTKKRLIMYLTGKYETATLRISLGPENSYRMIIRRAGIVDRVACSVRDRWPTIYPIVVSLCLLGIVIRLDGSASTTAITIAIYLAVAANLDFLFESLVALGLIHVLAVTVCFLVIFSGTIVHNVTARFLARIVYVPSSWFEWLLGGFDRLPILTTFILLSLISTTCGAIAILLSVPIYFLKLTKMYNEYLEELFMASLRQFLPRFGRGKRRSTRRKSSAIDSSSTEIVAGSLNEAEATTGVFSSSNEISRGTLLNHLLLFVTWSIAAVPALPSAFVWAKNFRYETRLTTEDPVMIISWLVLTCWGSLGFVEIPTDESRCRGNRRNFCANVLRVVALFIAFTAMIERSAYYQWTVPPLVAFAVSCLALLSLFPGDATNDNHRIVED